MENSKRICDILKNNSPNRTRFSNIELRNILRYDFGIPDLWTYKNTKRELLISGSIKNIDKERFRIKDKEM